MRGRLEMHGVVSSRKIAVSRSVGILEMEGIRGGWRVAADCKPQGVSLEQIQIP